MDAADFSTATVLLIENDEFLRSLVKRMLKWMGVSRIGEAGDGTAALALLGSGLRPGVILCDINMEPMDGVTFVRRLRGIPDPSIAGTPVVMLTGHTDEATVRSVSGLGISSYVVKPVSPKALRDRMAATLAARPAVRVGGARPSVI